MNILYIGDDNLASTSRHRADSLTRIGHNVYINNPYIIFSNKYINSLHYHTGYFFLQNKMLDWVTKLLQIKLSYDFIWINSGELLGVKVLQLLKSLNVPIILYVNDDPTGGRDGNRFNSLIKSISFYDLCAVVRDENIDEFYRIGAKKVLRVPMSYDEVKHDRISNYLDIPLHYKSEVAFIGTWMKDENRDIFLKILIDSGINISIWGDRWEKSKLWKFLKKYHRGESLSGRDYVYAIQGSKICIGLLSKRNRDLYTTRSVEIPFAGGLLCAERTSIHQEMYKENKEALFWDNAEECVQICKKILGDDLLRESIRNAGMKRVLELNNGNEDVCKSILNDFQF